MADRKLFEAIQDSKREYGISTEKALIFLRTQRDYKTLQDKVSSTSFRPTLRELSHLCNQSADFFEEALRNVGISMGLEQEAYNQHLSLGLAVIKPYTSTAKSTEIVPHSEKDDDPLMSLFEFDYEEFCKKYSERIAKSKDPDIAFRQAAIEALSSDHPYLSLRNRASDQVFEDQKYGERITFADFARLVWKAIPTLEPMPELPGGAKRYMERNRADYLSYLEEGEESPNGRVRRLNLSRPTKEEVTLLYGLGDDSEIDAYDRALEEKTLHKIETERRVALNAALTNPDFSSDLNFVSKLITSVKDDINYTSERISEMDKDPNYREDADVLKTEVLDRERYKLRVLRLHKSWLERVLSN